MNRNPKVDQRGQAMSEALLMAGVFFILMIGINTSMSMQISAVQMLMDSIKKVFQVHLGYMSTSEHTKALSSVEKNDLFSSGIHSLLDEMNMSQPGLIQARSRSIRKTWDAKIISRQSFIDAGTGYASSDRAVQTRIETSASVWRDAFNYSSHLVGPIHALASKSDAAWSRPEISLDFIQPWAGFVPEQSMARSHIWPN